MVNFQIYLPKKIHELNINHLYVEKENILSEYKL
jgi:hypothetical protein